MLQESGAIDLKIQEKSSGTNLNQFLEADVSDSLAHFFFVILVTEPEDILIKKGARSKDIETDVDVKVGVSCCCVDIKRHNSSRRYDLDAEI